MPTRAPTHRPIRLANGGVPHKVHNTRAKTADRGYDATWRKLRAVYLRQHPLCMCDECKASGAVVAAEVVDHIIPIAERPELRLEWSNLRAMSKQHHDRHTALTQGWGRGKKATGDVGRHFVNET